MSYTIRDVSGNPLTVDSNLNNGLQLPKFSLSDSTGNNINLLNPLWTQTPDCPQAAAVSANSAAMLFSIDTTSYQSISVQITAPGTNNTITFECSNDNINWTQTLGYPSTNGGTVAPVSSVTAPTAATILYFPTVAQYFRARVSTYTSGTVTCVYRLRDLALSAVATYTPAGTVSISGTPTVSISGTPSVTVSGTSTNNLKPTTTSSGLVGFRVSTPAATNANLLAVKTGSGQIYGYHFFNVATTARYVHIYNLLTTSVTMGTTADTRVVGIPPGGQMSYTSDIGLPFSTAISIAVTQGGGPSDNTIGSIAAGDVIGVIDYI